MDEEGVEKDPLSGYMIPVLIYHWEVTAHSTLYRNSSFAAYRLWAGVRLPRCVLPSPSGGTGLLSVHE